MKCIPTPLTGAYLIEHSPSFDHRGMFTRLYCKSALADIGFDREIRQINYSSTTRSHSIRGMHYRLPPYDEFKILKCIRGSIYDVIIDLRKNSPTFLQYFATELSADIHRMMFIPEGFAHGFQSLQPNTEVIYFHTNDYHPDFETGIHYKDPAINIPWPFAVTDISDMDLKRPFLHPSFNGISVTS